MVGEVLLSETLVKEGAQAWTLGQERWLAWNAVLRNHVQHGRISADEHEAHVTAAVALVREQDRQWLGAPDIW